MKRFTALTLFLILTLLLVACGAQEPAPAAVPTEAPEPTEEVAVEPTEAPATEEAPMEEEATGNTIVDIAVADGNFETLVTAVTAAGLADTLSGEGPFTVFAPTDEVFAALPAGTLDELLADPEGSLSDVLLYHVVEGAVMAEDVVGLDSATTLLGEEITISVEGDTVLLNDTVQVVTTDIEASNGIIHVIDGVLIPPTMAEAESEEMAGETIAEIAAANENFSTLVAALEASGLVSAFDGKGTFTVFAPSDEAFSALPEGTLEALLEDPEGQLASILQYHVVEGAVFAEDVVAAESVTTLLGEEIAISVEGDTVLLNDEIEVITTDIEASNGVIHVIDGVLLPPSMMEAEAASEEEMAGNTIVDVAVADGRFETLVTAVTAAELAETLSDEGPFTVFAPTDGAFAALPEGTVEALLEDPSGQLTDILLYHVVEGAVFAEDVVALESAPTLLGEEIAISVEDGTVFLNGDIEIIITDIEASNGVIHVIDGVLIPAE